MMQHLERGQINVWRVTEAIELVVLVAIAVILKIAFDTAGGIDLAWLIAAFTLFGLAQLLFLPGRRYRFWAFRVDPDELHVHQGVFVRKETVVPFGRVQHTDTAQGPVERAFGVCRLVLHTAGTHNSVVTLPGLSRETADTLRDIIRAHIRSDLA